MSYYTNYCRTLNFGCCIFTVHSHIHAQNEQCMSCGMMSFMLSRTFYNTSGSDSWHTHLGLRIELQYLKGPVRTSCCMALTVCDSLSHNVHTQTRIHTRTCIISVTQRKCIELIFSLALVFKGSRLTGVWNNKGYHGNFSRWDICC